MSLATRCPSCGTVFRVVQDQLRISEGWVRCGRCNGVFDATEVLFDIDSGASVQLQPPPADQADADAAQPYGAPITSPAQTPALQPPEPAATVEPARSFEPPPYAPAPAWPSTPGPVEPGFAAGRLPEPAPAHPQREEPLLRAPSRSHDDDAVDDEPIVITDHVAAPRPPAAAPAAAARHAADETPTAVAAAPAQPAVAAAAAAQVQAAPSFMRQAERAALWRRPVVRAGLWLGVMALALLTAAQTALLWRDSLAAHWPAATPPLQALCRVAGCRVLPLRRIESLAVDSSGLNRLEGSTLYRLQLVLRNRADTAVMMPALDLTLSNAQGQLVARRVLAVAELGVTQAALAAGQELPLKALVSTGDHRVDGYTLELFYP
jgi:predicted Zn finger-like uncharacterized protein